MKKLVYILLLMVTNFITFSFVSKVDKSETLEAVDAPASAVVAPVAREEPMPEVVPVEDALYDEDLAGITLNEVGQVLLSMEDSPLRDSLLDVFTSGWFAEDHMAVAEWLNEQPTTANADQALAAFANLASEIDPQGAVEWAASVMTPRLREQALQRSVGEYKRFDPVGFRNFMASNSATARAVQSAGLIDNPASEAQPQRFDIIEDSPEPISRILARRTRLAGASSRVNHVQLTVD